MSELFVTRKRRIFRNIGIISCLHLQVYVNRIETEWDPVNASAGCLILEYIT
jgi:hypothetical protein